MGNEDRSLAPFRKFRRAAVRVALMLTGIVALAAYGFFDKVAAQGVMLGGLAGILSFWVMAVRLEKAVKAPGQKVKLALLGWSAFRLGLTGADLRETGRAKREEQQQ